MEKKEKKLYLSLDGLKGLCILIIVYYHYNSDSIKYYASGYPFSGNGVISLVTEYGYMFVEILFMLSGFFICSGYREKIVNREIDFKTFIIKRLKKIYPLFIITTLTQLVFELLVLQISGNTIYSIEKYNFYSVILNIFLIQSGWIHLNTSINSVTWYISVLFFCYILYYFTAKYMKERFRFIAVNIIYIFAGLSVMVEGLLHTFFNIYLFRGIACFSIGILLYYLNMMISEAWKKKIIRLGISVSFLVFILAVVSGNLKNVIGGGENQTFYIQMTVILFWGPLLIFCGMNWKPLQLFLSVNPIRFIGSISFLLYLWQLVVRTGMHLINLIFNLNFDYADIFIMLGYMGITFIVSVISTKMLKALGH